MLGGRLFRTPQPRLVTDGAAANKVRAFVSGHGRHGPSSFGPIPDNRRKSPDDVGVGPASKLRFSSAQFATKGVRNLLLAVFVRPVVVPFPLRNGKHPRATDDRLLTRVGCMIGSLCYLNYHNIPRFAGPQICPGRAQLLVVRPAPSTVHAGRGRGKPTRE